MSAKVFNGTREAWGEAMIRHWMPILAELGIEPCRSDFDFRVATAPIKRTALGLAYSSKLSLDGKTNLITLSPVQASAIELSHTLLHEYLHIADDCQSGHRFRWKRWADIVGIKARGHDRTELTEHLIRDALRAVGEPARHVVTKPPTAKATSSQIKVTCPSCERGAHLTAKNFVQGQMIACLNCGVQMFRKEPV